MSELTPIIEKTANGVFADNVTQEMMTALEQGELNTALWQTIEEAGLTKVLLSEEDGGAGGSWLDAEVILRASGKHRVPAPVGDALAAYWILAQSDLAIPDSGVLTWTTAREIDGSLLVRNAPWAQHADHLLVWADNNKLYMFAQSNVELVGSKNIAAEPRASGALDIEKAYASTVLPSSLMSVDPIALGALVRAVQMSGALDGALHLSVNYVGERVQFGRPIAKFQAISQQLALMSGHVATAVRAAGAGCQAMARDPANASFDIAVAKVLTSEAVEISTSIAHQVHAAIGITFEYQLNFYSRRLWSWRDEFGSDSYWAEKIGAAVTAQGGEVLWEHVTADSLRF